jgi:AcrR family transcriptional regulator
VHSATIFLTYLFDPLRSTGHLCRDWRARPDSRVAPTDNALARGPLLALACGSITDASSLRNLKPHLKQDEKRAETRRRVLEAAILCVIERGYANTTGPEIAERAGLSRGAQLYHFPTREDLFAKAVEHLNELLSKKMRQKVERLQVEADRRSIAIDLIWETVGSPLYQAWLELVIASRTDAYLRDFVRAVSTRLSESVEKMLSGRSEPFASSVPDLNLFPVVLLLMTEGLAISAQAREKESVQQVLAAAKNICGALFTPRRAV